MASAFMVVSVADAADTTGPAAAGRTTAQQALGLFGTKSGSTANISKPMTDAVTPLRTIDGTTSFTAKIGGTSTNSFLEVFMQPAPSGDLQNVTLAQDLDMDGTFDSRYVLPRPVSGVCANGYYSCIPGTWTGCRPFRWISDPSGVVSDSEAPVTDLGGCYCINSSCGSRLVWDNTSIVLKDLGGGVVAAVQSKNAALAVSSVSLTPVTISYYGRSTNGGAVADAANVQALPAPVAAGSWYRSPAVISTAVSDAISAGSTDPASLYSVFGTSPAVTKSGAVQKTCLINRNGSIVTETRTVADSGHVSGVCADHFMYARIGKDDESTYRLQVVGAGPSGTINRHCGDGSDWHDVKTVSLPGGGGPFTGRVTGATFTLTRIDDFASCTSGSGYVDGLINGFDAAVKTTVICSALGAQYLDFDWSAYFEISSDSYVEGVDDQCQALAGDSTCRLRIEEEDGVTTTRNYNRTGLSVIPSCRLFSGAEGSRQVCRSWWKKIRTYTCTGTEWNFSDVRTRYGTVSHATGDASSLSYTDNLLKDGSWTSVEGAITFPEVPTHAACETGCRTSVPHEDNEITTSGVASSLRRDPGGAKDFLYRTCAGNICPVEQPGEEIVDDCQCLSNFSEAAAAMQALRMAGKDTICTTGATKLIQ